MRARTVISAKRKDIAEVFQVAQPSGDPNNWIVGTSGPDNITGTTGNDRIYDSGGVDRFTGLTGNDFYDASFGDLIIEKANQGIDTVMFYGNAAYHIPEHVENVEIGESGISDAVGNELNNWMVGGGGPNILDGRAGSDVLTGGTGNDIFVFGPKHGADRIADFTVGQDKVRIDDAVMTQAQVLAAMTDTAEGAKITLASGATLIFTGRVKADFSTSDFIINTPVLLDLTGYSLTFSEEFDNPNAPLFISGGGKFMPYLAHWENIRRFTDNNEQQTYVDPTFGAQPYNPFTIHDGMLTIRAIPTPAGLSGDVTTPYVSGTIETSGGPASAGRNPAGFWQHYGYWELRAQLPLGQGMWPAFWLIGWGEIDIFEGRGAYPRVLMQSTLDFRPTTPIITHKAAPLPFDYSAGFHTYGLQWTPQAVKWFVDGVMTHELPGAPYQSFGESFLIVNLAIGGAWGGDANATTPFPAEMNVDYIRVYQNPSLLP